MTKNMFYNYDVYADSVNCTCNHAKSCENMQQVENLYNIKGEFIGIKAKENSDFNIYFNFSSEDDLELFNLLQSSSIVLELIDSKKDLVATFPAFLCDHANECIVRLDLFNYPQIKKGKYKIYLYYIEDNVKKILYNEANLLSIK